MIIGVCGEAQSGKDTICKIIQLIDIYEYNKVMLIYAIDIVPFILKNLECSTDVHNMSKWEKHAFANPVKECAAIILGEDRQSFESGEFKKQFTRLDLNNKEGTRMTNRQFLQYFGTEVGRNIDANLWVKTLLKDYYCKGPEKEFPFWIIPDVRFPNEAEALKFEDGIIIKVVGRKGSGVSQHSSEDYIKDIKEDFIINNESNLESLILSVIDLYNKIIN